MDPTLLGGSDVSEQLFAMVGDETLVQLKAKLVAMIQANITRLNAQHGLAMTLPAAQMLLPNYMRG